MTLNVGVFERLGENVGRGSRIQWKDSEEMRWRSLVLH